MSTNKYNDLLFVLLYLCEFVKFVGNLPGASQ